MSDGAFSIKVITKRHGKADPVEDSRILQDTIIKLRKTGLVPRGIYRFNSHEEAHQWMIKQMASLHARLKSKT